mmetsp:Transcript_33543/g.104194  ORF Transcript_33543/g.104194 Transcript_33543/m.104194 type:complete len:358 (+) Transcript_33543:74-1147(+)|eukprot:CAMPEP_0204592454 /NCGR_PEP_ID=MMETSP0661-20131031/50951_1 /ASSEMBLY_ACC=CAM_ASM_000606 /TAXON_ID=109239 /ORGANISM="Alexandrium margalefi, Strain AMGDE01CS-322" /LENGTH=357 /DNA_ID=CAMNT_0051602685 /DNA_START=39 /DNA_END=1112 /DNA_ORIENTATION=+
MAEAGGAANEGVLDLGILDGPVLLFGGAYSNLQALQAMLAVARDELHIPPERMIHTGDSVAYCAQPRETVELLVSSGARCLMGNCEESIGFGRLDCGCGFPEDSACNAYSVNWYAHVMRQLQGHEHLKTWMASLPRRIEFVLAGRRFVVVHGSPRNISEFLWPSTPDSELQAGLSDLPSGVDGVVSGHSGIPFARLVPPPAGGRGGRRRFWLNAGVIGMPANDGTSRGWYAVLVPDGAGGLEASIRALEYKAQQAADAIYAEQALVRGYADSLLSGVWPSHDVLPVEEQMATGVALLESSVAWPAETDRPAASSAAAGGYWPRGAAAVAAVAAALLAASLAASWWLRGRRRHAALVA